MISSFFRFLYLSPNPFLGLYGWLRYMYNNRRKSPRFLEIGCGNERIHGFETLNIVPSRNVDYILDTSRPLPFASGIFEIVYASHVLEHIPWYLVESVLKEWKRILRSGGRLEVWVPDGLKICKTLIDAETNDLDNTHLDGWYKFNPDRDPCVWASGRIFTYGDGKGSAGDPNWHRALFTPRYLQGIFKKIGFEKVEIMDHSSVRGFDHGWINLGVAGIKR